MTKQGIALALGLHRAIKMKKGETPETLHWEDAQTAPVRLARRELHSVKARCGRQHRMVDVDLYAVRLKLGDRTWTAYVGRCSHCATCLYSVDAAILDMLYKR